MRITLFLLIFTIASCSSISENSVKRGIASNPKKDQLNPRPVRWPAKLWRTILTTTDDIGYSLTQVVFDNIDEFEQDVFNEDKWRVRAKIKRDVYDNQDVLNSYSVMDYFRLRVDSKNITGSMPIFTPNLKLGFSFGVGGDMEWTNIRQVTASKYAALPTIDEEYKDLEYLDLSKQDLKRIIKERKKEKRKLGRAYKREQKETLKNGEVDPPTYEPDPDGDVTQIDTYGGGSFLDPSFRPRTSRLWNLVTFPFKLPVNLKRLAKMEDGELISYGVNGYVELGPNIGFSTNPFSIPGNIEINAFYRFFLKGSFKITILKENDRFVRVKITRKRERGSRYGIGGGARNYELYEGFLLFEGKQLETRLLQTRSSLIPLQFRVEKKYIKSFDVGFRYDLKHPEAREAFKKSVFGAFAKSIELQDRVDEETKEKVVERLFVKDATQRQTSVRHRLDLQFLTKNVGKRTQSVEAQLTLPNGNHRVFKESKRIDKEWKVAWGRFEKLNYNYTISLDKTSYLEGKKDSFQLIVEAGIEDSHTSGKEMKQYIQQIRKALGKTDLLPDLPTHLPRHQRIMYNDGDQDIEDLSKMKKARYRKSSFYYGFNINQAQLEKFINTPIKKMWPILEKSFGVKKGEWSTRSKRALYRSKNILPSLANIPLFLANIHLRKGSDVETALRIKKKWQKIQASYVKNDEDDLFEDIDYKIKLLSEIFSAKHYGHELLKLIMYSLREEEMDYFIVATNDAFGRIQQRGRITTNPEYLLNLTDENIGFERQAGGFKSNPDILVRNLDAKVLEDGRVKFEFDLDHVPEILYFKLFKTNRLQKFTILAELAYKNKSRFKKGKNTLVISKQSVNELEFLLGKDLEENDFYSLTVSSTTDGYSWSKVANRRFHYILPIPEEEIKPEELNNGGNNRKANKDFKRIKRKKKKEPTIEIEEVPEFEDEDQSE